jgi:small subunit ribosomal protein S11
MHEPVKTVEYKIKNKMIRRRRRPGSRGRRAETVLQKKQRTLKLGKTGEAHIKTTFNNAFVNLTDERGNTIIWRSGGGDGTIKGGKKRTPYAAQSAAEKVGRFAYFRGMREVSVIAKGPGTSAVQSAIRALHRCRLKILVIKDITPIPHNGCRPPKRRKKRVRNRKLG